jgi:hypothetical protein
MVRGWYEGAARRGGPWHDRAVPPNVRVGLAVTLAARDAVLAQLAQRSRRRADLTVHRNSQDLAGAAELPAQPAVGVGISIVDERR